MLRKSLCSPCNISCRLRGDIKFLFVKMDDICFFPRLSMHENLKFNIQVEKQNVTLNFCPHPNNWSKVYLYLVSYEMEQTGMVFSRKIVNSPRLECLVFFSVSWNHSVATPCIMLIVCVIWSTRIVDVHLQMCCFANVSSMYVVLERLYSLCICFRCHDSSSSTKRAKLAMKCPISANQCKPFQLQWQIWSR